MGNKCIRYVVKKEKRKSKYNSEKQELEPGTKRNGDSQQLLDCDVYEALCDVTDVEEGHLSFSRGNKIKVVGKQHVLWKGVNLDSKQEGYFDSTKVTPYDHLKEYPWYFGVLKRMRAEQLLLRLGTPGTFLIRQSESVPTEYSLSLRDDDSIKHYRIKCNKERQGYCIRDRCVFADLPGLVEHYKRSRDGLARKLETPCPFPSKGMLGSSESDQWETSRARVKLVKCLGQGFFSEVWQGVWNETIPVAVKMLKHRDVTQCEAERTAFLAEANIMKKLSHPKLVRLYAVCSQSENESETESETESKVDSEEPVYIILELMSNGNLSTFLQAKESKRLPFEDLRRIVMQIADGMSFLEDHRFLHRDLAARNILLTNNKNTCPVSCPYTVKIADFGQSKMLQDDSECIIEEETFKVAMKWAAPEVRIERKFSFKSDVWSFGVVMYEVCCQGNVPDDVSAAKQTPPAKSVPYNYYDLMLKCWEEEPSSRPSFKTLHVELSGN